QVIDYYKLDPTKAFSNLVKDYFTLYLTKHFQNMHDHFSVDIPKTFYLNLSASEKALIHERFKIITDMLYKSVFLKTTFKVFDEKASFSSDIHHNANKLKAKYHLTDLNLDYLRL